MTMNRFFELFPLVTLICLACLGIARGAMLYRRGIRVIAVDWERTPVEMFCDLVLVTSLLAWAYHVIAYSWPLPKSFVISSLGVKLIDNTAAKVVGSLLLTAGVVIYGMALVVFGNSWRLGIDRETPGGLVTTGIFEWTRNPIYLGFDLLFTGMFLVQGRLVFLLLAGILFLMIHETICREERFLRGQYGEAYRDYCARVGRYVTVPCKK